MKKKLLIYKQTLKTLKLRSNIKTGNVPNNQLTTEDCQSKTEYTRYCPTAGATLGCAE